MLLGEITLDSRNIRSYRLRSLRGSLGMVQQDVYLFFDTFYENIVYGRPGARREEVEEAARAAGADAFIRQLKDGYDTYIGERGVKLSGGQKQRISIARVFLKDPRILILDEATSALDTVTEQRIQASLEELCRGRTGIIVAHRLSTVRHADEIAVIEGERVAEYGTHAELIEKGGLYARLWQTQKLA